MRALSAIALTALAGVGAYLLFRNPQAFASVSNITQKLGSGVTLTLTKVGAYVANNGVALPIFGSDGHVRAILDLIARAEANRGYDSYYAGARIRPTIPVSQMTLAQIHAWQVANRNAGAASTAIGRYQFIQSTLDMLTQGIAPSTIFSASLQDQLGLTLLQRRGLAQFLAGAMSAEQFAANLAREWAGLPKDATGVSAYEGQAGNHATVSWNSVINTIRGA